MAWITKHTRRKVHGKYNGHCAYCGKKVPYNEFQLDHKVPRHLFRVKSEKWLSKHFPGVKCEHIDNYEPSCERCNKWKGNMTLEQFRSHIWKQLLRQQNNRFYNLLVDYGLIKPNPKPIVFYFETFSNR